MKPCTIDIRAVGPCRIVARALVDGILVCQTDVFSADHEQAARRDAALMAESAGYTPKVV